LVDRRLSEVQADEDVRGVISLRIRLGARTEISTVSVGRSTSSMSRGTLRTSRRTASVFSALTLVSGMKMSQRMIATKKARSLRGQLRTTA